MHHDDYESGETEVMVREDEVAVSFRNSHKGADSGQTNIAFPNDRKETSQ